MRIPRDLPVRMISGERDPVHDALRGFKALARALLSSGLERLTERVYPEARHELLNETNRDQVSSDLLEWLESNVIPT